jgi:hypothetical protein
MEFSFTEEDHQRFFWMVAETDFDRINPQNGRILEKNEHDFLMNRYQEDRKKFDHEFKQICLSACPLFEPIGQKIASIVSLPNSRFNEKFGLTIGPEGIGLFSSYCFGCCFIDFRSGFVFGCSGEDKNVKIPLEEWYKDLEERREVIITEQFQNIFQKAWLIPYSHREFMHGSCGSWIMEMYKKMYGFRNSAITVAAFSTEKVSEKTTFEVTFWDYNNDPPLFGVV